MHEIAEFLGAHPPFDALTVAELARVADAAEIEFHPRGELVFDQGAAPVQHVRVVRTGAIELLDQGRVFDLLGPGELFGHPSMLSGMPAGLGARAQEDTLCYRLPDPRPLLDDPGRLGFLPRSLLDHAPAATLQAAAIDPGQRPAGSLLRGPAIELEPGDTIRSAARRMADAGQSCAVVVLDGSVGIVTDRDLRRRVVADGTPVDAPVSQIMSSPAYTVTADHLGAQVLLEMLDRGVRHFPVVGARGEVLGVLADTDLMAVETRTPFHLRAAIAAATTVEELAVAAARLTPTVLALHDARVAPLNVSSVISVVADALTRRLLDLTVEQAGPPPVPFAWLALGSIARREAIPSSDVDSAIVWHGDDADPAVRAYVRDVARRVSTGLQACGFAACEQNVTAAAPLFSRSLDEWESVAQSWLEEPTQEKALILVSVVVDGRPVWGMHEAAPLGEMFRAAREHPEFLNLLARFALSHRPPTGFLGNIVLEHSGEHKGLLDIKNGGLLPVVDLARWAGMAAGVTSASTNERLAAASAAGTLSETEARTLQEAFDLFVGLRLEHQVGQLRAGETPDDFLDPATLNPLTRSYLKEAFRAVASVQRQVAGQSSLGRR